MKTKLVMSVVSSLVSVTVFSSCVMEVPDSGGHGPIIQRGGPPPGYNGRPIYGQNRDHFNHENGYQSPLGRYYQDGNRDYNRGPNIGSTVYHGDQRRQVHGNGPQSYAQWGQPDIRYQGR